METNFSSTPSGNGSDKSLTAKNSGATNSPTSSSTSSAAGSTGGTGSMSSAAGSSGSMGSSSAGSTGGGAGYGEFRQSGGGQRSTASLRSELSSLKSDLDALVNRAPNLSDEELAQAHARLMQQFSSLRYAAKGFATEASRQFNRGMETTSGYVKEKPVQSVAVAVGAGLLLGMLMKR